MKMSKRLTGRFIIQKGIFGWSIKVQIYKTICDFAGDESPDAKIWVRAKFEDLVELGINQN